MQVTFFALLAFGLIASQAIADSPSSGGDAGPRPPANWKPSGHVLLLPARQQTAQFYGPPPAEFAARQVAPVEEEEEEEDDDVSETPITDEYPSTTPQTDESSDGPYFNTGFASKPLQQRTQVTSGVYHVLLPDGRLQRVEYTTTPLKQAAYARDSYSSQGSNQFAQQNVDQTGSSQKTRSNQGSGQFSFQKPGSSQKSRSNQGSGQFSFQKPSFQSNQFALNAFKQNQFQENNLGQNSANGQYRINESPSSFQYLGYYQQGQEPKSYPSSNPSNNGKGLNKPQVNKTTQGEPAVGHSGPTQGKPYVGGKAQGTPAVSQVSGTGASYTNPQPLYPSYTYQPIEFARQQEAGDSPSSQFVFNGYLASVAYPNQEPAVVPSPVYSYSSAPLVRILRRTD